MMDLFASDTDHHAIFMTSWATCSDAQKKAIQDCLPGIDVTDHDALNDFWLGNQDPAAMKKKLLEAYLAASE